MCSAVLLSAAPRLTREHAVLPAAHIYPQVEWAFTTQPQSITTLRLALISCPM